MRNDYIKKGKKEKGGVGHSKILESRHIIHDLDLELSFSISCSYFFVIVT